MYIKLTADELNTIIDGLNAAIENRESESECTQDKEILEANDAAVKVCSGLIDNLRSQMEHTVESLDVAVMVKGGMVQAAYANGDIFVDVYDLDVSDYPDYGEQDAADAREADLRELASSPGWRTVY